MPLHFGWWNIEIITLFFVSILNKAETSRETLLFVTFFVHFFKCQIGHGSKKAKAWMRAHERHQKGCERKAIIYYFPIQYINTFQNVTDIQKDNDWGVTWYDNVAGEAIHITRCQNKQNQISNGRRQNIFMYTHFVTFNIISKPTNYKIFLHLGLPVIKQSRRRSIYLWDARQTENIIEPSSACMRLDSI